jgi:hypothetical protein
VGKNVGLAGGPERKALMVTVTIMATVTVMVTAKTISSYGNRYKNTYFV